MSRLVVTTLAVYTFAVLAAPSAVLAQAKTAAESSPPQPLRLRLNPFRVNILKVEAAPGKESVTLRDTGWGPTLWGPMQLSKKLTDLSEGVYIGLSPIPNRLNLIGPESLGFKDGSLYRLDDKPSPVYSFFAGVHLFRGQVSTVQKEGIVIMQAGPATLKSLKVGDRVALFRPPGATTAEMKNVPDWVPFYEGKGDVKGISVPDMEPTFQSTAENARLICTEQRLQRISKALASFAQTHGRYPPASVTGPDGKPWHSWRVLLLLELGFSWLHDQYHYDEPWNGPNNLRMLEYMPAVYANPLLGQNRSPYTHLVAVVGPGTAFPSAGVTFSGKGGVPEILEAIKTAGNQGTMTPADITDPPNQTALFGPVSPERKILWTKPEDFELNSSFAGIGQKGGFAASTGAGDDAAAPFVFADSNVFLLTKKTPLEMLRKLVTIADGGNLPELSSTLRYIPRQSSLMVLVLKPGKNDQGSFHVTIDIERPVTIDRSND